MSKPYQASWFEYLVPIAGYFRFVERTNAHLSQLEPGSRDYRLYAEKASKRISGLIISNAVTLNLMIMVASSGLEKLLQ